jgi:hypothetical protein
VRISQKFILIAATIIFSVNAQNSFDEFMKEQNSKPRWKISFKLKVDEIQAVQACLLDINPVSEFAKLNNLTESSLNNLIQNYKGDTTQVAEKIRVSQYTSNWNVIFKKVQGDDVHLILNNENIKSTLSSPSPDGQHWFLTKVSNYKGTPVCWCVPVELTHGETSTIVLSEENMINLLELASSQSK